MVYQNEEGQWVTDLAYYSSFKKEVDGKTSENVDQFQTEDFVPSGMYQSYSSIIMQWGFFFSVLVWAKIDAPENCSSFFSGDAMEKILKDQEDFEKEHQFMQVDIRPIIIFFPENW